MIKDICSLFDIKGEYVSYDVIKDGNINNTYRVKFLNGEKEELYIVQRINDFVFKNPSEVMENILSVTNYIKNKVNGNDGVTVLTYKNSIDGKSYVHVNGNYWRCYEFINNTITFSVTDNLKVIEETGRAFGEFSSWLSDYDASSLNIVIEDFHNPIVRYERLKELVYIDDYDRVKEVSDLIEEFLLLEELSSKMNLMMFDKELPLRVVHNDTKCNNVLFDNKNFKHVAVIDLDTVMPGLLGFDFGDAIRCIASSAKEDEEDISKIYLDLDKFEAFSKGYLSVLKNSLTEEEKSTLVLGCITITIELGVRFLIDYLDGDKYFKIDCKKHNLIRSRCQLTLLKDMIKKEKDMERILDRYL